jgi:hypothetical protein
MTERQPQRGGSDEGMARSGPLPGSGLPSERAVPLPPLPPMREIEPTLLGFPAEFDDDSGGERPAEEEGVATEGDSSAASIRAAILRRPDRLGGAALISAGIAAGMSLWLPWRDVDGATGLVLARRGLVVFGAGIGELGRSGLWQPLAVVLGGGAFLVLGLLLLLRARSHRIVGLLALLVAVAAAAAVLVPLSAVDWHPEGFGPGMWSAVTVAALGVFGALKAMLTAPLVRMPPGPARFGLRRSVVRPS